MRKSRLEQVDIDISAHIMFVSNAVISTRLKKAARDHLRDAAFVEYVRSISSAVSSPPLVALQSKKACGFFVLHNRQLLFCEWKKVNILLHFSWLCS